MPDDLYNHRMTQIREQRARIESDLEFFQKGTHEVRGCSAHGSNDPARRWPGADARGGRRGDGLSIHLDVEEDGKTVRYMIAKGQIIWMRQGGPDDG